jgi:hypothetical protein
MINSGARKSKNPVPKKRNRVFLSVAKSLPVSRKSILSSFAFECIISVEISPRFLLRIACDLA